MINLTKRNTDFNARPSNFALEGSGAGALKLGGGGGEKRRVGNGVSSSSSGPIVTVTPFGEKNGGGKVSKLPSSASDRMSQVLVRRMEEEVEKSKQHLVMTRKGAGGGMMEEKSSSAAHHHQLPKTGLNDGSAAAKEVTTRFGSETTDLSNGVYGGGRNKEVLLSAAEGKEIVEPPSKTDSKSLKTEASAEGRSDRSNAASLPPEEKGDGSNLGPENGSEDAVDGGSVGDNVKTKENKVDNGDDSNSKDNEEDKPQVKLSRKSPYVTSSAILKGTPKPVVVVKGKPPVPGNKPKLPRSAGLKPKSPPPPVPSPATLARTRASQQQQQKQYQHNKSPVAAPRNASFRGKSEYANSSAVTFSSGRGQSSKVDLNNGSTAVAESYNSEADVQSEVIFEVNATMALTEEEEENSKTPVRREEALEKIRKSLEEEENKAGGEKSQSVKSAVGFAANLPCR